MDQSTLQSIIDFAKLMHSSAWAIGMAAIVFTVLIFIYIRLAGKIVGDPFGKREG